VADYTFDNNVFTPSGVAVSMDTPSPLQTSSDLTIQPVTTTLTIDPTTVTLTPTESTVHSDSVVKLEPVVTDVCAKITFGPVPRTCIRQPLQGKVALTVFGIELLAIHAEGELHTIVESAPETPRVVWGGERSVSKKERIQDPVTAGTIPGFRIRLGS